MISLLLCKKLLPALTTIYNKQMRSYVQSVITVTLCMILIIRIDHYLQQGQIESYNCSQNVPPYKTQLPLERCQLDPDPPDKGELCCNFHTCYFPLKHHSIWRSMVYTFALAQETQTTIGFAYAWVLSILPVYGKSHKWHTTCSWYICKSYCSLCAICYRKSLHHATPNWVVLQCFLSNDFQPPPYFHHRLNKIMTIPYFTFICIFDTYITNILVRALDISQESLRTIFNQIMNIICRDNDKILLFWLYINQHHSFKRLQ